MKKIILILSIIVLAGCKSKKIDTPIVEEVTTVKLAINEVSTFQKDRAYNLGKRILMTCNTSKFKPFTESEATRSVINNITLEKLSKTCTKYRQWYGDFKDLQLMEIYKDINKSTTIFRYKALYTKKVANKELRVYINEENKISAIKSMDWVDLFERK
ncbi:hypothetical protein [Flavobacterium sp. WC2416]|uniref:Lipoprotein n=1 Tax=Flavobacterium sp. WC2416 TaxID=3234141 RepID=A0AB39W6T0_9FLAO